MKKIILVMLLMLCMSINEATAQNVFIATSNSAVAYHKDKSCFYIKGNKNVKGVKQAEAENIGRHACPNCYGEKKYKETEKAAAKKRQAIAKKAPAKKEVKEVAKEEKKAEKKVEKKAKKVEKEAKKAEKTTPERDAKGRFVSKKKTEEKAEKKATPQRDAKGRFVSSKK